MTHRRSELTIAGIMSLVSAVAVVGSIYEDYPMWLSLILLVAFFLCLADLISTAREKP